MKQPPRPTIDVDEFNTWRDANPEPAPDLPMLRKVISAIDAEPDRWSQHSWGHFIQDQSGEWSCGTARCVAGWAATFAPTLVTEQESPHSPPDLVISDTASYALGLTRWEAIDLFESSMYVRIDPCSGTHASRSEQRENIQVIAEQIAERAGETL